MSFLRNHARPFAAVIPASLCALGLAALSQAADHNEAPGTMADNTADIADVYAWHDTGSNSLTAVITFAGLQTPAVDQAGSFSQDVLYTLHIDNDGDETPDINVLTRFGQNDDGEWGVQVENLPGAGDTVIGPVEQVIAGGNGTQVFAGLREDPFFFDLQGFQDTVATGTLSFDNDRDRFEGTNVTAIVLRMGLSQALDGGDIVALWATTGRI